MPGLGYIALRMLRAWRTTRSTKLGNSLASAKMHSRTNMGSTPF